MRSLDRLRMGRLPANFQRRGLQRRRKRSSPFRAHHVWLALATGGFLLQIILLHSSRTAHQTTYVNRSYEVEVVNDITPPHESRTGSMFCAALWQDSARDYVAMSGSRPPSLTSYRLKRDGSIDPGSFTDLNDRYWEDPRLLQLQEGVLLAFFQRMGEPFAVARLLPDGTLGPISKLGVQTRDGPWREGTKNWAPFSHKGVLHFLFSPFPTIVLRCESPDNMRWDLCTFQSSPDDEHFMEASRLGDGQQALIFRGGSQLEPYPTANSETFVGFLHTRYKCDSLGDGAYLHVPVFTAITWDPKGYWRMVYISDVPFVTAGIEWPKDQIHLLRHHIQDPVSIARIDYQTGDIYLTMNLADNGGKCALAKIKGLLPSAGEWYHRKNNWLQNKVENPSQVNITREKDKSMSSILQMCSDRYAVSP